MHVALALAGTGDLHELRPRAHVLHGGTADVAHRRAQAAGELVDHAAERAAVRHAAFDAFGHELVGVAAVLEVAILGPRSEEHTSELQSLMRNSYAVFCLKKKKKNTRIQT